VKAARTDPASADEDRAELHSIPFEQLRRLQKDGFVAHTPRTRTHAAEAATSDGPPTGKKIGSKKRKKPLEVSSKTPVAPPPTSEAPLRKKRPVARDPRFSDLSGPLNMDRFRASYSFLDDIREREKDVLQQTIKQQSWGGKKRRKAAPKLSDREVQEAQNVLKSMRQQDSLRQRRGELIDMKRELKQQEKKNIVETGKKPFFYSEGKVKQLLMKKKYEELKKQGKVDAFVKKKRKRQAAKDRKLLPNQRPREASLDDA